MPGSCVWCGQPTDGIDVYCSRDCEADHDLAKDEGTELYQDCWEDDYYPTGTSCFPEDDGIYDDWRSEDLYDCG